MFLILSDKAAPPNLEFQQDHVGARAPSHQPQNIESAATPNLLNT